MPYTAYCARLAGFSVAQGREAISGVWDWGRSGRGWGGRSMRIGPNNATKIMLKKNRPVEPPPSRYWPRRGRCPRPPAVRVVRDTRALVPALSGHVHQSPPGSASLGPAETSLDAGSGFHLSHPGNISKTQPSACLAPRTHP